MAPVLSGNNRARRARITPGSCSPADPSSVYERSKPLGPSIFMSQRSLACEPMMVTRQAPELSASTCSIAATISPWSAGFPVLCSSTVTPTADSLTDEPEGKGSTRKASRFLKVPGVSSQVGRVRLGQRIPVVVHTFMWPPTSSSDRWICCSHKSSCLASQAYSRQRHTSSSPS
jgi:hypothetical protein